MSLPDRIRERLEVTGKTARGASLEAGLSAEAIRVILDGQSQSPRLSTISKLAEVLECDVSFLAGEADEPILHRRLRDRMAAMELNQFSTAIKAGLDRDYVRNIFRNKSAQPGAERLLKIASALDTTMEYLIGATDDVGAKLPELPKREPITRPANPGITIRSGGRVTLDIKAEVSVGVAAQILALIEGDKP